MAKKGLVVLVLVALVAGGAFAQAEFKLSAGVGGYFTSDFGGGVEGSYVFGEQWYKTPYAGGGGFVFLDATFVELSLGFWGGSGTMKYGYSFSMFGFSASEEAEADMSLTGLDIGLLGKYPIALSDQLSFFPLLGISYRVILAVKDEDGEEEDDPGDFSALWFRLGAGLDYSFTDSIYLRAGILYGIRLANKFENDLVSDLKDQDLDAKALLGHGLEVKVAIGFRF